MICLCFQHVQNYSYNLDMLSAPNWKGRIIALGLRPNDAVRAKVWLLWVKVSEEPQGPPELKVRAFALEDALPRVGVPTTLVAIVTNTGGETAKNVRATLSLPKGVTTMTNEAMTNDRLTFGDEVTWQWSIKAQRPLR